MTMRSFSSAARIAAIVLFSALLTVPAVAQGSALDRARAAASEGDFTNAARLYDEAVKEAPKDETVLTEAGDVNMELERYATARDYYKRAVDRDSKNEVFNRKYALSLSALGSHTEAVEAARKAMKSDDGSLESSMTLGQVLINAGKDSLNTAELTILTASKKFPNAPEPQTALGDLYFARGVYELAQTYYEKALSLDAKLIDARVRLGRSYREMAIRCPDLECAKPYYSKALTEYNDVTVRAPKNARAWLEQGEILMLAQEYEKAGQSFTKYVELRPEDPRGDILLARAAYEGRFYLQAIEPLERVLSRNDSISKEFASRAHLMLGLSYMADKKYDKARDAYARVPDAMMQRKDRNYYASAILTSGGDTAKSLSIYRQLLEEDPNDCSLSLQLGNMYYKMKKYADVVEVFSKRIQNCPNEPKYTSYLFIGLSQFSLQQYAQSATSLHQAIAADSSEADGYFWLMNVYAKADSINKAAEVGRVFTARSFDETVKENASKLSTAYFFMGFDKFNEGKNKKNNKAFTEAIAYFERAAKLNPDNGQNYLFMAYCHQYLNEKEGACKNYRQALKLDPSNANIKKNLSDLGC